MKKLNLGDKVKLLSFGEVANSHPELLSGDNELYGISRSVYDNMRQGNDLVVSHIYEHVDGDPEHTYVLESEADWTVNLFIFPEQCIAKVEVNNGADSTVTDSGAL